MPDRPKPKPRVLVVDDTSDNIHILMDSLQKDYAIIVAKTGEKALSILREGHEVDIILLDIMMPGIDGYEVCRQLKLNSATADIPVIFITALTEDHDEARGLALGAVDFITKPFNPQLVKARVRNQLNLHVASRQIQEQADELRAVNRDLRRNLGELKSLHEQRSELLGMAVHDLKNPLSAISGLASLLKMQAEQGLLQTEKNTRLIGTICRSSDHMLEIIQDMLASEKLDSGQLELKCEPRELAGLVHMVIELNKNAADRKNISLEVELVADCKVNVDSSKIHEVLDNLVSNAIKFSPPGKRVWLRLAQTGNSACLTVKDEGPGLTEEDKTQVFGRFKKLSARPTGGESSSGLGLSIVKRLVEMHNGAIDVQSEAGQGAAFTVTLPLVT